MSVTAISDFLRQNKQDLAQRAAERYFVRHPKFRAWQSGVDHTLEDKAYTVDFLASSIEIQSVAAFTGYIRWLQTVLVTRNLDAGMLPESLIDLQEVLEDFPAVIETALPYFEAAQSSLAEGKGADSEADDRKSAYLQAVLSSDRRAALTVVEHSLRASEPASVYVDVIATAMHAVGRLWQGNKISVAREHMATATTQYVLAQVYSQHSPAVHSRGKAVVSGMQGEFHQLGAHMVADVLDYDGWDVRFLGTNMPHEGIIAAIEEHEATVVGLSATMLLSTPKLAALINEIKQRLPSTRVLVGGSLVSNRYIDPIAMGADAGATTLLGGRELARSW